MKPPSLQTSVFHHSEWSLYKIQSKKDRAKSEFSSRGITRDKLNGTNGAKFAILRRFSLMFAVIRFFLLDTTAFGGAENCRKPQKVTESRRKPQETADFCRNPICPIEFVLFHSSLWNSGPCWGPEKLKKAVAVSEEKIQQRSRRRGRFSSSHFRCRNVPKPLQGKHFVLPENRGMIFQQRRNLPDLVAWFARIDSHDSRESGDLRESEIGVTRANRPDAL